MAVAPDVLERVKRWKRNGVPVGEIRERLCRQKVDVEDVDEALDEAKIEKKQPNKKTFTKVVRAKPTLPRTSRRAAPKAKKESTWLTDWVPGDPVDLHKRFNMYPREVFRSRAHYMLSHAAQRLHGNLYAQWNGRLNEHNNNGRLLASLTWLRKNCRWGNSSKTLADAIEELMDTHFIYRTREGVAAKQPAWYGLIWIPRGVRK
jgi:hypothetical protein